MNNSSDQSSKKIYTISIVILSSLLVLMVIYLFFLRYSGDMRLAQNDTSVLMSDHLKLSVAKTQYSLMLPSQYSNQWDIKLVSIPKLDTLRTNVGDCLKALLKEFERKKFFTSEILPEIRNVFLSKSNTLIINIYFSSNYPTLNGIESEKKFLDSILLTLNSNFPDIKAVRFLVNNSESETFAGHIDISREIPLGITDNRGEVDEN